MAADAEKQMTKTVEKRLFITTLCFSCLERFGVFWSKTI
jgi:hypothetical protein